ncbi:MAG: hypothetical protein LKF49_04105 [Bifidobacterium tibiigranuli]|uniref:hypothetical protein n=1 Tax=Bifidobacterium tibiigranuli TaxID=2172043 RepID=UPI002354C36F|nr:hypothetical protein [Bifidobacterium tibiigranuli]MCH3975182.1 hypothetical protein [Bifidobacterium tibiigranuli]MCH4203380.1 hypothetical protein [Bifidobacterium tibiigranuli]MCH4274008.1 hypothetical protein [Bifidobacterium tibiigranuli]
MDNTTVIEQCCLKENLRVRKPTEGPEIDLVRRFVEDVCNRNAHSSRRTREIVFLEPRIDSGYPDIVIAHYDDSVLDDWSLDRALLSDTELRILSYLVQRHCGLYEDDLTQTLGFSMSRMTESLQLLADCHMVNRIGKRWKAAGRSSFLGIRKLVTIEAKMSSAASALSQAFRNTRFASHSYVLLGSSHPTTKTCEAYERLGVGLLASSRFEEIVKPEKHMLPGCYVTLQFNEWIGRSLIDSTNGLRNQESA